jgi:hypothetical protein
MAFNAKANEGAVGNMLVANTNSLGYDFIVMDYNGGIRFHTLLGSVTSGNAAFSERMKINTDGNIGIGETSPSQKLSVAGTLGILEGGSTPTKYTIFQGGDQSADITYTLPVANTTGLLKNTAGVWSWDTSTYLTAEVDTWATVIARGGVLADNVLSYWGTGSDAAASFTGTQFLLRSDYVGSTDSMQLRAGTAGLAFNIGATQQMLLTSGKLGLTTTNTIDVGDSTHLLKNLYTNNLYVGGGRFVFQVIGTDFVLQDLITEVNIIRLATNENLTIYSNNGDILITNTLNTATISLNPGDGSGKLEIASGGIDLNGVNSKILKYANVATEGYGVPAIVDDVAITARTTAVGSTNFTNAAVAGRYRISYYLADTTADITAGTIQLTVASTDGAGATTVASTALPLTAVGRTSGVFYVQLSSGAISYSTTLVGVIGTSQYSLHMTCERVI